MNRNLGGGIDLSDSLSRNYYYHHIEMHHFTLRFQLTLRGCLFSWQCFRAFAACEFCEWFQIVIDVLVMLFEIWYHLDNFKNVKH